MGLPLGYSAFKIANCESTTIYGKSENHSELLKDLQNLALWQM